MEIKSKKHWIMKLERQEYCAACKLIIENKSEQELGYHIKCLQLPLSDVQRLNLLKEKIIELTGVFGKITLLDYEVQDHAIVEININSAILADPSKNLTLLQEMITIFPGLKALIIGEEISNLPTSLKDMDQLEILGLVDMGSSIGNQANMDVLRNIKSLKKLNLSFNSFESLPEELFELTTLTELDLSNNGLDKLNDSINKLVNLERLNISDNRLRNIPESIGQLKKLKYLDISRMEDDNEPWELFNTLPESIGELEKLEVLNTSNNLELASLPESIGKLKNLRKLDLSYNNLKRLPDTLDQLLNLEEVSLYGNKFEEVPKFLFKLHKTGKLKRVFLKEDEYHKDQPSPLFT